MTLSINGYGSDVSKHMKICVIDFTPNLLLLGYINTLAFCRNKNGFFVTSPSVSSNIAHLGYKPEFFFDNLSTTYYSGSLPTIRRRIFETE